jgi:hypothetical protein
MRPVLLLSVLAGAVALTATPALCASTLFTPPIVHETGEGITCIAVNVGNQSRMMKADVLDLSGTELDSEQDDAPPGGVVSASGDGNYCRFTVEKKNDARASAHVQNSTTGATLAVVPAQ